MKKTILLFILWSLVLRVFAQSDFMYAPNGEKIYFKVRKELLVIKTNSVTRSSAFTSVFSLTSDFSIATIDTLKTTMDVLKRSTNMSNVINMLEYTDGTLQAPSDIVFVKCKEGQNIEQVIDKLGLKKYVKSIELINRYAKIYSITFDGNQENTLRISQQLYETGLCEFAEPSFIRLIKPSNPLFPNQWGLNNTGQLGGERGIDIDIEQAWSITRGNNVRVAVIDEGVDLTHPDLTANLLPGFDATTGAPGGINGSFSGNDRHGTGCAGIIGAVDNNIGVVGVAPGCRIIPIRMAYRNQQDRWVTNDQWIATAINFAWERAGADVLSNSWSGGTPSATITAEIRNAVTLGRNRLGCAVIFSAGNDDRPTISYPSNLTEVIAVGAISQCGERKSPSSCDREGWWGSNYGSGLDVVAPGVNIETTNIRGYTSIFNGTSAACPFVAGIAALILSIRPDFTQAQVRQAIESSCDELRRYSFTNNSNRPNGRWNNEVGYGKVNALNAVSSVLISGPTIICSADAVFSLDQFMVNPKDKIIMLRGTPEAGTQESCAGFLLKPGFSFASAAGKNLNLKINQSVCPPDNPNRPANDIVTWSCSPNLRLQSSNGANNTAVFDKISDGAGWIQVTYNGFTLPRHNVWVGLPELKSIHGPTNVKRGEDVFYMAQHLDNPLSRPTLYEWHIFCESEKLLLFTNASGSYDHMFTKVGHYLVGVSPINACGTGSAKGIQVNVSNSGGGYSHFSYPNPASHMLNVEINYNKSSEEPALTDAKTLKKPANYDIRLYDWQGSLLKRTTSKGENVEFNIGKLPNGVYYLHIYDGVSEKPEMHQIVIEH